MVVPILAALGAALGGSALLGSLIGKGKKDCSAIAAERCSKGGIGELWRGEETDFECYDRIYNSCVAERQGTVAKMTPEQKDAIVYGGIGVLALAIIGKYGIVGELTK